MNIDKVIEAAIDRGSDLTAEQVEQLKTAADSLKDMAYPSPYKLVLQKSIFVANKEISEIEIRRPTAGELRKCPINKDKPMDMGINLMTRQCGIPISSLDDVDGDDYMHLNEVMMSFLGAGRLKTR